MYVGVGMPPIVEMRGQLVESVLSFHMGLVDWTQVVTRGNKCHNLLCHLIGPGLLTIKQL